ncbi:MAG: 2-isopropylmalate synthase [Leptospiraceae bacterium]|nr:2-isopropylmalate synthase [Leptospiraceae bacterium]MCK6380234.1 2-isopropylmalate synthase [Leptospiraceae bacterium]NUM42764.1 2-isopropylmalate synthase [Leptospiraceae bacterium]
MKEKYIEILDVTLRDGEQTRGVSFSGDEKLGITKFLLLDMNIKRVEIASARVSKGELSSVKKIFDWARTENLTERIEILGFVDENLSIDWISEAGGRTINLLTKGSKKHLTEQLKKSLKDHLFDIEKTVNYADKKNIAVNVYLEDWSNGIQNSPEYVFEFVQGLSNLHTGKIFLADTLGILSPEETFHFSKEMITKFPSIHFEFHGHNDYDLSVANCISAVNAGVKGIHVSVNGLGERAGNTPLEAVVTALHDKVKVKTGIIEKKITQGSRLVEIFSGKRIAENRPIVGQDVFTQTAGIHADGDKKGNLYANPILPERFGRKRSYALGKLAGKASISENLKQLGLVLSSETEKKVLERVIELGDQNKTITQEDLPFLIADLEGEKKENHIEILSCIVTSGKGVFPKAELTIKSQDKIYEETGIGDGGYDAFMDALSKIMKGLNIPIPCLLDYQVRIPPGGKTSALVETIITWGKFIDSEEENTFRTVGVDSDQITAAIKATEKMLNLPLSNS